MLALLALTGWQFCWAVKQSRVQAGLNLLSILPVSCTGFAALTALRVVNASQRKRKSNSHDLFIRPFLLWILNGAQNRWSFKRSDCQTWIRHVIIKLCPLFASSSMDFHSHFLMAGTATLQVLSLHTHYVSHWYWGNALYFHHCWSIDITTAVINGEPVQFETKAKTYLREAGLT